MERHQEGTRKSDPCGCAFIWSRGRWWPTFTCADHYAEQQHEAEIDSFDSHGVSGYEL